MNTMEGSNSSALRSAIARAICAILMMIFCLALSGCASSFERVVPGSVADLKRSDWVLSDIDGVDMITDRRPTLRFSDADEVNGFSGCNKYRGRFVLTESEISITDLALTRVRCRNKVMGFEQGYIARLKAVSAWKIQRHSLRLLDPSGATMLRFRRIGTPAGSNI